MPKSSPNGSQRQPQRLHSATVGPQSATKRNSRIGPSQRVRSVTNEPKARKTPQAEGDCYNMAPPPPEDQMEGNELNASNVVPVSTEPQVESPAEGTPPPPVDATVEDELAATGTEEVAIEDAGQNLDCDTAEETTSPVPSAPPSSLADRAMRPAPTRSSSGGPRTRAANNLASTVGTEKKDKLSRSKYSLLGRSIRANPTHKASHNEGASAMDVKRAEYAKSSRPVARRATSHPQSLATKEGAEVESCCEGVRQVAIASRRRKGGDEALQQAAGSGPKSKTTYGNGNGAGAVGVAASGKTASGAVGAQSSEKTKKKKKRSTSKSLPATAATGAKRTKRRSSAAKGAGDATVTVNTGPAHGEARKKVAARPKYQQVEQRPAIFALGEDDLILIREITGDRKFGVVSKGKRVVTQAASAGSLERPRGSKARDGSSEAARWCPTVVDTDAKDGHKRCIARDGAHAQSASLDTLTSSRTDGVEELKFSTDDESDEEVFHFEMVAVSRGEGTEGSAPRADGGGKASPTGPRGGAAAESNGIHPDRRSQHESAIVMALGSSDDEDRAVHEAGRSYNSETSYEFHSVVKAC